MSGARDERGELDRGDARFVARLAEQYAPRPLEPAERAAFDARLRARLERRRPGLQAWVPALAGAAGIALVLLVGRSFAPTPDSPGAGTRVAEARSMGTAASAAQDFLLAEAIQLAEVEALEAQALPADYAAIATAFLDR